MTHEEIKELDLEQIETRMAEIGSLIESADEETDIEALSSELDEIQLRKAAIAEQRKSEVEDILDGAGEETEIIPQEETKMDLKEIRSSHEYVEAYAKYIKTEDPTECRALLSEMATDGVVPVPTLVEGYIQTAWEKDELLSLVKKSYMKGIVRIGFEKSATGAVIHEEGAAAPDEETLVLGIVELKPASIKKWITISDEVIDTSGEAFLRYVYDEVTHQIAKAAADSLIGLIAAAPSTSTASAVAVGAIEAAPSLGVVAAALSELSDRATNPVVIINKKSFGTLKALQYSANYPIDVFEGLSVKFNDTITAIGDASEGDIYMIVGDLGVGAQANFPNGEDIKIKYDDLSLAEADLVKIVGRQYVALGLIAPNAICVVKVPET